jgi:pyruvate,water dikinase
MLEITTVPAAPQSAQPSVTASCVSLHSSLARGAVGKAAGLARLAELGLPVPSGFVVIGASPGELPVDLADWHRRLGGAVAVRSSALGEDAAGASHAGQYATVLGVEGEPALRRAIERCLGSLESARADAYHRERTGGVRTEMCVVVQRMIEPRAAGVLFTADPHTGRRDRLVVDAVRGRGEALVSGHARPDHCALSSSGAVLARDLSGGEPILCPLDLEWAFGADGRLWWLQARPITALPADPHELDTACDPKHLYTNCNIGECMPGALTPLGWTTVWLGNDHGLQFMRRQIGIQREPLEGHRTTRLYSGHAFFDFHELGRTSTNILGASDESLCLAICGRLVPEFDTGPKAPLFTRVVNSVRYLRYILSGKKHQARLEALVAALRLPEEPTAIAQLAAVEARMPQLLAAFDFHIASSAGAGALEPALMQILAKGKPPTEEQHAQLSLLLAGSSEHDVESADVVAGIDRLVALLAPLPEARARFVEASPPQALAWLTSDPRGAPARELAAFLERHGHHCLRELELREKEWSADPLPVIESLQASLRARLLSRAAPSRSPLAPMPIPRGLGWLVRMTQAGVRRRERTKSLLVKTVTAFKRAFRRLGELLVKEGRLPDADALFFLRLEELGPLARGEAPQLAERAVARRRTLDYQATLRFPDVFFGAPEPLQSQLALPEGVTALRGKPVSHGRVTGTARVALTLDDAAALQPGEILISPVTDVGWSPYFSLIAGLATDVGSSVSHGAVVAREYGLPAVVDLRQATRMFKTGDRVTLDGDHGILQLADR